MFGQPPTLLVLQGKSSPISCCGKRYLLTMPHSYLKELPGLG